MFKFLLHAADTFFFFSFQVHYLKQGPFCPISVQSELPRRSSLQALLISMRPLLVAMSLPLLCSSLRVWHACRETGGWDDISAPTTVSVSHTHVCEQFVIYVLLRKQSGEILAAHDCALSASLSVHPCLIDLDGAAVETTDADALEPGGIYVLMSCEVPLPRPVDLRMLDENWHQKPAGRVADSGIFETPSADSVHAADQPLAQALRKFFMGRRRKPHRGKSVFDLGCGDGGLPQCQRRH